MVPWFFRGLEKIWSPKRIFLESAIRSKVKWLAASGFGGGKGRFLDED
jgi:hypothetical protein